MNETVIDDLYTNFGAHPGWLSWLSETFHLNREEIRYLEWRDRNEQACKDKLKLWHQEIESYGGQDIYFEPDESKQFVLLTEKINQLEKLVDPELINRMVGRRYHLRERLIKKAAPDLVDQITDADIDRARAYPLWKLMGLPRPKNIKCPYHDDANPSFQVSLWGFCHTCRAYVDSIGWFMDQENGSFLQAVKALKDR